MKVHGNKIIAQSSPVLEKKTTEGLRKHFFFVKCSIFASFVFLLKHKNLTEFFFVK